MTFKAPHRNPLFYICIVCFLVLAGVLLNQSQFRAEATASPLTIEPLSLDVLGSDLESPAVPEAVIGSSASGWARLIATPTPVPKAPPWPNWVRVSRPDLLAPMAADGLNTEIRLTEGTLLRALECGGQRCRVVFGGNREDDAAEGWVSKASLSPTTAPKWAMTWRGTHLDTGPSAGPQGGIWLPSRAVVEVVEDLGDRLNVFYLGDGRTRTFAVGLVAEADLVPAGALLSAEDGGVRILTQAQVSSIQGGEGVWLQVPHRTQLDGTPAGEANCGPSSIGMALEQLGSPLLTWELRELSMRLDFTEHAPFAVPSFSLPPSRQLPGTRTLLEDDLRRVAGVDAHLLELLPLRESGRAGRDHEARLPTALESRVRPTRPPRARSAPW